MNQLLDFVKRYWAWISLAYLTLEPRGASNLVYAVGSRLNAVLDSIVGSI